MDWNQRVQLDNIKLSTATQRSHDHRMTVGQHVESGSYKRAANMVNNKRPTLLFDGYRPEYLKHESTHNRPDIPTFASKADMSTSLQYIEPLRTTVSGQSYKPIEFPGNTETMNQFTGKKPFQYRMIDFNNDTVCRMQTDVNDRPPLDLTKGSTRYLDIYLTTSRLEHRPFDESDQTSIVGKKNIYTFYDHMNYTKSWGFGLQRKEDTSFPLTRREKNMTDAAVFKKKVTGNVIERKLKHVPNSGLLTEFQQRFGPSPVQISEFIKYPSYVVTPTTGQVHNTPSMYGTEYNMVGSGRRTIAVVP